MVSSLIGILLSPTGLVGAWLGEYNKFNLLYSPMVGAKPFVVFICPDAGMDDTKIERNLFKKYNIPDNKSSNKYRVDRNRSDTEQLVIFLYTIDVF